MPPEAREAIDRCFEIDPDHRRGYWQRADILYRENQDNDAAILSFQHYLATNPPARYAAHAWYRIGQAHPRMRRFDQALEAFTQSLEMDRSFKPARERIRQVRAERTASSG